MEQAFPPADNSPWRLFFLIFKEVSELPAFPMTGWPGVRKPVVHFIVEFFH
jgi:hypothetical protein